MESIPLARIDYTRLDEATSATRVRLNSTVVRVKHEGAVEAPDRPACRTCRRSRAASDCGRDGEHVRRRVEAARP
jgi:hypothetical protein